MKLNERQLRKIVKEAAGAPDLEQELMNLMDDALGVLQRAQELVERHAQLQSYKNGVDAAWKAVYRVQAIRW